MFENVPTNLPTAKEPEDILGASEKAPAPSAAPPTPPSVAVEKPSRSWFRVILILAVLAALGFGVYLFFVKGGFELFASKKPVAPPAVKETAPVTPVPPPAPAPAPAPEEVPVPPPAPAPPPPAPLDSDGDGLTDEDEARLGTDALKADTDGDGLLDNEEVRIYKSDPLNPDTDNDGFKDGDEVKNGYNPVGPGRLFQVPTQ